MPDSERSEGSRGKRSVGNAKDDGRVLRATHMGNLPIGNMDLPCAVLEDGARVLSERGVTLALGGKRGGSHWRRVRSDDYLPVFLSAGNLAQFIPGSLRVALANPIKYRPISGSGSGAYGINAALLPEICEVFLRARRSPNGLLPSQEHMAMQAEVLMGGLATVGIIALVDEATGYQEVRDRSELNLILEAYIAKELLPWAKRFPDEFYQEMFRLRGWAYSPPSVARPSYVGKLTNEIVYARLPEGVLPELQERNPVVDGRRKHKHHQLLTEDIGNPHLEKHIAGTTALMRASDTWAGFIRLIDRAYPKPMSQIAMEFPEDAEDDD
jgi:hypothetical protein